MRLIGSLPAEADARQFVDYLLTRHVAAQAEAGGDGAWQVWIEHDDQVDDGKIELEQFRRNPADPRFAAAADAAVLRKQELKAAGRRQKNFRDVRTTMFAGGPPAAVPVTMALIGIAVAAFVVSDYGGEFGRRVSRAFLFCNPHAVPDDAFASRWVMFRDLARGQLWRLLTPAFLHGDILHILFNMLWMLDLGRRIEPVKGSVKFIGLVLTVAVLSNLAQAGWTAVSPFETLHFSVFLGMSGVVAGLFGYAWMCGKYRPYERIGVTEYETGLMLGWLVICSFGFVGPIANAAHWGGLLVGILIGAGPTWWRKMKA